MICSNCIHFADCCNDGKTRYYGKDVACGNVEELCKFFKDKDNFVEVVRCKDCRLYDMRNAKCLLNSEEADQYSRGYDFEMYANDFCSYGEKRSEDNV